MSTMKCFTNIQARFIKAILDSGKGDQALLTRKEISEILSTVPEVKYPYWITSSQGSYKTDKRSVYINPAYTGVLLETPRDGIKQGEVILPSEKKETTTTEKKKKVVKKKTAKKKKKTVDKDIPPAQAPESGSIGDDWDDSDVVNENVNVGGIDIDDPIDRQDL